MKLDTPRHGATFARLMLPADLVVTSTRVVTPDAAGPAAVAVTAGTITAVTAPGHAPPARQRLDAGGAAVLPGLVDTHVHVNEPGRTDWEGFHTATRAAAAGGVTTIVDMPLNSLPVTTTVAALSAKAAAARDQAVVDYGFWGGAVAGGGDDLAALQGAGVLGFKAFLVDSGTPEFTALDPESLEAAMRRLADLGSVLLVHAELPGPIAHAARQRPADPRRYASWLAARPAAAELEAIDLVARAAARTGCRTHVVHLACADGVAEIAAARAAGARLTVETCPHYLTFAAEEIPDGATAFKCAPPIRGRVDRDALWAALGDARIDLVASDHSPCPPTLKRLDAGDFFAAWGGIASLELLLPATWTGARARGHGLPALARWLAEAPARLAGLDGRKGRIAVGCDADLVIFEPDTAWTVDPRRLHHRHPVTPYAGRDLFGRVTRTYLRGRCVFDGGSFPSPPVGRWLRHREPGAGSRTVP
ncbi:MAG TPA: allantoinase AllB [Gemmatimonadales bacterium]|nr:allantoinase AllB [Gemmatimonadales bacterium]